MGVAQSVSNPCIDVVIPVYNCEKFIGEALTSVMAQTYPPRQIIVVDDGSTDNTEKVVVEHQGLAVPVVYIGKKNGGPNSARNVGIMASDAEFIATLDSDDFWEPTKLQKQLLVFKESVCPNLGVVYCDICPVDSQGRIMKTTNSPVLNSMVRGAVFDELIRGNCVAGSASGVVIRRECLEHIGFFDESLRTAEDWDMWLRLAEAYQFDYVNEKLVYIRHHASNRSNNTYQMILGRIQILAKLHHKHPCNLLILSELRYHLCRMIAYCFLDSGIIARLKTQIGSELWAIVFRDKKELLITFGKVVAKFSRRLLKYIANLLRGCWRSPDVNYAKLRG